MKRKLRVLCLFDIIEPKEGEDFSRELETEDWRTEADILRALEDLGHERSVVGVFDDVSPIVQRVREYGPDVVFNLTEQFAGHRDLDKSIAAVLDLLGVPYTGAGPMGLGLARDKALAKKILTYHRVGVPAFVAFERGRNVKIPRRMPYPVIVKPLAEDASEGIARASLVSRDSDLRRRVRFIHQSVGTDAIAEEYVEGREVFCSILGNDRLRVLPLREVTMGNDPRRPRFCTYRIKWDPDHRQRWGVEFGFVTDLDREVARRVSRVCKRAYRVLQMRDYARLDLRLAPDGRIVIFEANPNPFLARGEDFAESASEAGIDYPELVDRILALAVRRGARAR